MNILGRIILLLLLFLISTLSFGQAEKVDSLVFAMEKANDEEKFDILHELHISTYRNNIQKSCDYAIQAITLAEKLNVIEPLIRAYQDLGISYILLSELDSSLNYFEKARVIAKKLNNDHAFASSTRSIGSVYWYKNDFNKALEYYKESLNDFECLGNDQQIATCVANLGSAYYAMGDFQKSIEYFQRSYDLLDKEKYPEEAADCFNDIGNIYQEWGNQNKALEYFLKALKSNEKYNNKRGVAVNLENIGNVYFNQSDYLKALDYYTKVNKIYHELNNPADIAFSYIPLGNAHHKLNNIDSSLFLFKKALKDFEFLDQKQGKATVLKKIGDILQYQKKYRESVSYYNQSAQIAREIQDNKSLAGAYSGLGISHYYLSDYSRALSYLLESANLAYEGKFIYLLQDNYHYLAETYQKLNNKDDQISYLKKYIQTKDSVLTIEKQKQVSELQAKYETEKKDKEIELLNKEKEINKNKLLVQKTINYGVITILLILAIGTFLLFRRIKEKHRINKLLSSKNKEIQEKQTKIENQNTKLAQQTEKLHELDEIKSRFFTNISHEFRTPLTLIIGPVEQLLLTVKDKNIKESLNLMLRNAQKLLELINQLLEISKIEKGNVKLKFRYGNIKNEVQYIVEMFSSLASEKKLSLNFKTDSSDFNGYIDKEKFDKIIMNLLSNSFKHTKKGSISIDLRKSTEPGKIKITVSDTGIGIKKEKLPYIFDRFYQVENNETAETAGTGIGLSFTKELIKLYKGEITAQSEPEEGTRFIINLPVSLNYYTEDEYELVTDKITSPDSTIIDTELTEKQTETSNQECPDKKPETILVVEDHTDLRKFIASNLSDCYHTIEASNGKEGIDKALEHIPDIIITDIMMPKVNGIELTRTLKNDEKTSHIPIIMLTAKSSSESIIEGLETEADDYLTKPFNIKELQIRISNLVKTRKKLQEKYHRSISINPSEITTTSIDEQFISKLLKITEENMANSDFSVEILCDLSGMSRANIHKKLKSLLNQSATEFINSIRLKRAAQLIKQNAGNISEIAYDVGFSNLSYFSRAFKNHFNITPKEMMENKDNW